MNSNDDKCHLIVANQRNVSITLGRENIESSDSVELLGIQIDNNLNFNNHVSNLIKKGNQKLHALARISKYLSQDKLKIIMKTFIQSHCNYWPLIWMFHSRSVNNKINKLHERDLRLVHKDENLTFPELLEMDNSVSVHHKNLQRLAIEMYKTKDNISPKPMQTLFTEQLMSHDLRHKRTWEVPAVRIVCYGTETVRFRGLKIWGLLPMSIKESKTLTEIKARIKTWKVINCTCSILLTSFFLRNDFMYSSVLFHY